MLQDAHHVGSCDHAGEWLTRGECGPWTLLLEQLYLWSHLAISAAYVAIPVILLGAVLAERTRPKQDQLSSDEKATVRTAYAFFIAVCGIGHLEGVVSFVWPAYPVFAWWHALTAVVSWYAVLVTVRFRAKIIVGI